MEAISDSCDAIVDVQRRSYTIFNQRHVVAEGWYWLLLSSQLKRGAVRAVNICGYELAVYRSAAGDVHALNAYCPHMGAHLAEGRVEGEQLRCFFHNWRFDSTGQCTDIPCKSDFARLRVTTRSWHVREQFGLIWIWLGDNEPHSCVPVPPELREEEVDFVTGNVFHKNCHPNVVMINAIDEQHFRTVHKLPGHILRMEPTTVSAEHIAFTNAGSVPTDSAIGRVINRFYRNTLTYNLDYWYGSTGTVTLGPDFLHLYLMFTLRQTSQGHTEGYAVAFTRKRSGIAGTLLNRLILFVTKLAGLYFAQGDTRVFQSIKFCFATPIAADRAVISFIQHLERQQGFSVCSK